MTATKPHDLELFVEIDGQEYSVTADRSEGMDPSVSHFWVTVSVYQPDLNWWKPVFTESSDDCRPDLDAIRWAFKKIRRQQNKWVESWADYRGYAAMEKGGKKAYYTRLANEAKAQALKYAPQWRLCLKIWKQITRL